MFYREDEEFYNGLCNYTLYNFWLVTDASNRAEHLAILISFLKIK